MKPLFLLFALSFAITAIYGQLNPNLVLARAPNAPGNICDPLNAQRSGFEKQLYDYNAILKEEIRWRRQEEKKIATELDSQMKSKVATQYGLNNADVQKIDAMKNMTKKQRDDVRKEMAEKMMQQSTGGVMSVEDLKEFKNIKTNEGKSAYAKSLAKPLEAEKEANPQKSINEAEKIRKLNTLLTEQQNLIKSLGAMESKYEQQLMEIELDSMRQVLLHDIRYNDSLRIDFDLKNSGKQKDNPYTQMLVTLKRQYCNKYTPDFVTITNQYIAAVGNKLTQYARLEQLTDEITRLQTGLAKSPVVPGLLQLEKIDRCTAPLKRVYQFQLLSVSDVNPIEE